MTESTAKDPGPAIEKKIVPQTGGGHQILKGSIWMVALRWAIRLTGVLSTVILARLLSPKDFGVVAIAMIVVGFFEVFNDTGQGQAIIRHKNPTREHYDSAWTVSLLIGLAIGIAIAITAPLSASYFHDNRAVLVMQCLALRPIVSSLENVGTVDFHRDLTFGRVFGYLFWAKIISFVVTVALAVLLRNYWALVGGILTGQVARTLLSYWLHPYRPKLSFAATKEIWGFSIWSFFRSLGSYSMYQLDTIAVGGVTDSSAMGRYVVAKDVATSPTDEICAPIIAVLFPVMARSQDDSVQMKHLYLRTLGWTAIIAISTSVGIFMVAPDMVSVILGSKWIGIASLMGWISATAGVAAMADPAFIVLDVLGMPRKGAQMQWIRVGILGLAIVPLAYLTRDLEVIAVARFAVTFIFVPSLLLTVGRRINVGYRDYGAILWRPLIAGGAIALAVHLLNAVLPFGGALRMLLDVGAGSVAFGVALMALWIIVGRPASAEGDLLILIRRVLERLAVIRARGTGGPDNIVHP